MNIKDCLSNFGSTSEMEKHFHPNIVYVVTYLRHNIDTFETYEITINDWSSLLNHVSFRVEEGDEDGVEEAVSNFITPSEGNLKPEIEDFPDPIAEAVSNSSEDETEETSPTEDEVTVTFEVECKTDTARVIYDKVRKYAEIFVEDFQFEEEDEQLFFNVIDMANRISGYEIDDSVLSASENNKGHLSSEDAYQVIVDFLEHHSKKLKLRLHDLDANFRKIVKGEDVEKEVGEATYQFYEDIAETKVAKNLLDIIDNFLSISDYLLSEDFGDRLYEVIELANKVEEDLELPKIHSVGQQGKYKNMTRYLNNLKTNFEMYLAGPRESELVTPEGSRSTNSGKVTTFKGKKSWTNSRTSTVVTDNKNGETSSDQPLFQRVQTEPPPQKPAMTIKPSEVNTKIAISKGEMITLLRKMIEGGHLELELPMAVKKNGMLSYYDFDISDIEPSEEVTENEEGESETNLSFVIGFSGTPKDQNESGVATVTQDIDDLSKIWKTDPDVSRVFGVSPTQTNDDSAFNYLSNLEDQ